MTEWYDGLAGIEQFLLGIAVFSTLIFMIQLCLSLIGIAGDDMDFDSDVGDDGFGFGEIFTLRNGVSFLMGFSWGGLMAYDWGFTYSVFVAVVGFAVGFIVGDKKLPVVVKENELNSYDIEVIVLNL